MAPAESAYSRSGARCGWSTAIGMKLAKFLYDPFALQPRYPLDPENAVELVDLVLETDGEEALRLDGLRRTDEIFVAHAYPRGAFDLFGYAWHRDTALGVDACLFR